jgi:hypothetical protein
VGLRFLMRHRSGLVGDAARQLQLMQKARGAAGGPDERTGHAEQILEAFRSPEALSSWLGLCPDNRISGGKVLKAKTRKVSSRLAAVPDICSRVYFRVTFSRTKRLPAEPALSSVGGCRRTVRRFQ